MNITDFENGFKHLASVVITDLEADVKSLATTLQKDWPAIEDLLTSGKIGQDILYALNLIGPVLGIISLIYPPAMPLITWAESILKQIAALKVFNTPCTCPSCSVL